MKYQTIEIEGKKRPIRFSMAALYQYEKDTGRNAISDFSNISKSGSVSLEIATDLVFAGLVAGHMAAGLKVDFSQHDVAEWAFSESDVLAKAMKMFEDAFQPPGEAKNGAKKKAMGNG